MTAQGKGAQGGGSTSAAAGAAQEATLLNMELAHNLLIISGCAAGVVMLYGIVTAYLRHVRTLNCLNNDNQKFYAIPSATLNNVKKNILYAPIFNKRHNREFQIGSVTAGTLPTRLQLAFLLGYFAVNVAFCVVGIDFSQNIAAAGAALRNRAGSLAVVNLIPLYLMAGRNNLLIILTRMSFDTYNLLHRYFGRIVVLEAITHFLAFFIPSAIERGVAATFSTIFGPGYIVYGFVAVISFIVIGLQASSPLRHAFYETFKVVHIALAALVIVMLYCHLSLQKAYQLIWLFPAIAFWAFDRACRIFIIIYRNAGQSGAKTLVETLPGGACRVTVTMARPWMFRPGQHAYLYMPNISLWQSHPFSVAWSSKGKDLEDDKLAMVEEDFAPTRMTTMSFIIRGRNGFTGKLCKKAENSPDGRFYTTCFAEGPYGGMHTMRSYGTMVMFAGGVGITYQIPHVRELVAGYADGTVATRKMLLVWTIRSPEHMEWIRPWITEILAMEKRRDILHIVLFVSQLHSTREFNTPSELVQMFPGRPDCEAFLRKEMESQIGAIGVSVCGPGALSDEVRHAVRANQHRGNIDYIEEAFSW